MKRSTLGGLLATTALLASPSMAWAQDSNEIVVTARKVTESLQDAAAAIDVISAGRLEAMGVTDVRAVQFIVPSIRLNKQQAVAQMFIRGVGIASDAPGLDMGVALTFNGIEQFREATGSSFFDIERVEVLRGPQATTYGSNAAGGVINVVLARPTNDFSGRASLEVGNYGLIHTSLAQNLPLGENAEVRIALDTVDRDGYSPNGYDDQETRAGRVTLTARPTDNFDFMVWAQGYHAGGLGDFGYASPFVNPSDPWDHSWDPTTIVTHFPNQRLRTRDVDLFHLGGEFNVDLGGATLSYIPGYVKLDHLGHLVIDVGPARILFQGDVEREQFTHELRLAGANPDSRLQWLAGLYHYQLDTSELRTVAANRSFNITDQSSQTVAAYAELTYALAESFRLTGGLRYSEIEKSILGSRFTPGPSTTNPSPIPFNADLSWDHVDWKVGLEFDVAPQSMAYVAVQTGYLGGGVNFFNLPNVSNEVEPEELLAYIIGMKNTFFDNRLRLNVEAFYYDWENYQVGTFNVDAGINVVSNAPKSESYGFELDADYILTENDRLRFGLGLFRGEFTDYVIPVGVSSPVREYNFTGLEVPFAPELTATVSYERTFNFSNGSRLVGFVQAQYSSEFWTSFSHGITRCVNVPPATLSQDQCVDTGTLQPEATMVNLDFTWHSPNDRWSASLWGRNLLDEAVRASGGDGGMTPGGVVTTRAASTLAPPRTYGVRLTRSW